MTCATPTPSSAPSGPPSRSASSSPPSALPDLVSALLQLLASFAVDAREVACIRLAGALRAVVAQRLVTKGRGGKHLVVDWVEATPALREAVAGGSDAASLKRVIDKAVKDGKGETASRAAGAVDEAAADH